MSNQTCVQYFDWYCNADGHHWNRFREQAPQLMEWGITAAWLPPAYKGSRGAKSEGYDVYDLYDLGEFDQKGTVCTKYGTRQQYIDAVNAVRAMGMKVYVDVVLNHMVGGDEIERIKVKKVNSDNRNEFVSDEMEIDAYTKFTFPGRQGQYSQFIWDHKCFTGVDFAADTNESAIFSIQNEYGEGWEDLSHDELGNFDYLIANDIETRNPAVREELKRWIDWYYNTVQFDGIRLDAVKHINPGFLIEFIDHIRAGFDPNAFVIGEFWLSDNLNVLLNYIEITGGRMSLFDAPLHHNLARASREHERFDLRQIFDSTLVAARPDLAVTFVDNHDTQPLQALEEYTEQWFKPHAYALILLREHGYPVVFNPDLYGSCYSDKNREGNDCDVEIPALKELPELLKARKDAAYGVQTDYWDDPNCIGWTREGVDEFPNSGCAVVISNHPEEQREKIMKCGERFAGKYFYDVLGYQQEHVLINEHGEGTFKVHPRSISVYLPVQQ